MYFVIFLSLGYISEERIQACSQGVPGVGTNMFRQTGMCRSNGSLSYKKSLNMGPAFTKKILKHGSNFLTEPKFLKTLKILAEKVPIVKDFFLSWKIGPFFTNFAIFRVC